MPATPRAILALLFAVFGLIGARSANGGTTVAEIARIKGQGRSTLQGVGLVVGLSGTGDNAKDLVVARPLAEVLKKNGVPVADFSELSKGKSVALVALEVEIPEEGARIDDVFDVRVSTMLTASSLKGGRLVIASLRGPYPELDPKPYAIAKGGLEMEEAGSTTTARIPLGASMIRDVTTSRVTGEVFDIVLRPHFAGYPAATQVAQTIHQEIMGRSFGGETIAVALDDRVIRVRIPESQQTDRPNFVADVMKVAVDVALMRLPAQVICDTKRGAIVITGNVEIAPAVLTQRNLSITSITPAPVASPQTPIRKEERYASVGTNLSDRQKVKLADLLAAFNQLNVPVDEQMNLLRMLQDSGSLHAKLVIE
jgi:flagellar P-ring protein FlgI